MVHDWRSVYGSIAPPEQNHRVVAEVSVFHMRRLVTGCPPESSSFTAMEDVGRGGHATGTMVHAGQTIQDSYAVKHNVNREQMVSPHSALIRSSPDEEAQQAIDICGGTENNIDSGIPGRVLPSVGAFAIQCGLCLRWRLIPTKEQYEEIRQFILEDPFICSRASSWRPNASCDDPSDLSQDMNQLWAIDRPNIPLAPTGWERLLVLRGEGSTKFADVYYKAPSGKKLRSMPEVERFLAEHPQYLNDGVSLSQFSFVIPRPLGQGYVRRKSMDSFLKMRGSIVQKKPRRISSKERSEKLLAQRTRLAGLLAGGRSQELQEVGRGNSFVSKHTSLSTQLNTQTSGNTVASAQIDVPGHFKSSKGPMAGMDQKFVDVVESGSGTGTHASQNLADAEKSVKGSFSLVPAVLQNQYEDLVML